MTMTMTSFTHQVITSLWRDVGKLPVEALASATARLTIEARDEPYFRTSFRLNETATAVVAATAMAASYYAELTGQQRAAHAQIKVNALDVALGMAIPLRVFKGSPDTTRDEMVSASLPISDTRAKAWLGIPSEAIDDWDPLAGLYATRATPGRDVPPHVRLHTNFPHHKAGVLAILGLPASATRAEVAAQLAQWDAAEFERTAQSRGMCVTMYRSAREWADSEMGRAVSAWLNENGGVPVRIEHLPVPGAGAGAGPGAPAKPRARGGGAGGLRVLDMSRVIAAPVATRTLAAHGADVLLLSSPGLPNLPVLEKNTARNKHTAYVDLNTATGTQAVAALVADADVFCQAYRPGGLASRGLSVAEVVAARPGIVYAELCAFGFSGPWAHVRGFDSLVQTATGLNHEEALAAAPGAEAADIPKPFPVQALDYIAGYLIAFATLAAKCQLEHKSASAHVQTSLAAVGEWLKRLGRVDQDQDQAWTAPAIVPDSPEVLARLEPYRVRGLPKDGDEDGKGEAVFVLAVDHAAAIETGSHTSRPRTVPAHLNVDEPKWW